MPDNQRGFVMLSFEDALRAILSSGSPLPPVKLPLDRALGKRLAQPVAARWDQPSFDNSAMDGYALSTRELPSDLHFNLRGEAYAGHPFQRTIGPGETATITTGAPLPEGCDAVVPVEDTRLSGSTVILNTPPVKGQHVRTRGEEYRAGELLLESGTLLRAGAIALIAGAGIDLVEVYPKPRVGILSTGDELVPLGETPGHGQIVDSNLHFLIARLEELGCLAVPFGTGHDSEDSLIKAIQADHEIDLLITTGGVSVGKKDHVQASLDSLGFKKIFWKVAIKPGKPLLFGRLGKLPVLGLPGNPAATAATFELFAKPLIAIMSGQEHVNATEIPAILTRPVQSDPKRQSFVWGLLEVSGGEVLFHPSTHQSSGHTKSVQGANALLPILPGIGNLQSQSRIKVFPLYLP